MSVYENLVVLSFSPLLSFDVKNLDFEQFSRYKSYIKTLLGNAKVILKAKKKEKLTK